MQNSVSLSGNIVAEPWKGAFIQNKMPLHNEPAKCSERSLQGQANVNICIFRWSWLICIVFLLKLKLCVYVSETLHSLFTTYLAEIEFEFKPAWLLLLETAIQFIVPQSEQKHTAIVVSTGSHSLLWISFQWGFEHLSIWQFLYQK